MSGSMIASAALKARVRRPALLSKLARAEDLIHHFPNGSYIGWSGFTGVGAPKLGELQSLLLGLVEFLVHVVELRCPVLGLASTIRRRKTLLILKYVVPMALADHVEKNKLEGQMRYSLFVGASSGAEVENRWAKLNMIERRTPHQVGKEIAKGINDGRIKFFDKHLSMFPVDLLYVSSPVVFLTSVMFHSLSN